MAYLRLNTVNGNLTLGSVYRLFVVGWVLGFGIFFTAIALFIFVGAAITGEANINGVDVRDRAQVIAAFAPIVVVGPIIIFFQGFIFAGLMTFGVRIYRHWFPLTVESTTGYEKI
ncbi:MAG: hypothetical protein JSS00_03780 [Proteobacteria bacterium]|nr:hypothetical protein [Pseudomonadota bacterium]